mmetsp:Transcript_5300/g.13386  ORF Transcript_5300/g.13386 Transcript_5300/m.13386 type:complete len:214 (+) Transcript_5300:193-834(+)
MGEAIVGIGAVLEPSPSGPLQVTRLVPGGPAQVQGGINVGDMLTMVDGVDVRGMDLSKVAPLIRGQVGTTVTLAVLRPGSTETTPVMLARQPTARITGPGVSPAKQGGPSGILSGSGSMEGGLVYDEAFPRQTLEKLRQLRVTLEQERIAVAKEREQSAKLQATLESQVEKLESRCRQLLEAMEAADSTGGFKLLESCGHRFKVTWCDACQIR